MPRSFALSVLVARCQQRSDLENSTHITTGEWNVLVSEQYGDLFSVVASSGLRYFESRTTLTTTGAATVSAPSFRQDIEPVLTRTGCNMGACHGKLTGQNGFKLSLRGYAPELDFGWLTDDIAARRINPAAPEESLLLTKPLGLVAHDLLHQQVEGVAGREGHHPEPFGELQGDLQGLGAD